MSISYTVLNKLKSPATMNWRICRAASTIGGLSVAVKVIATLKELLVASYFGRGDVVDAFGIAYLLPSFVVGIVAMSFNAALIPTFVEVRERQGMEAAQRLLSTALVWSQSLLLGLSLALAATAPVLIRAFALNFSPAKLLLTTHLFYAMLPIIVLGGAAANCAAVLNAFGKFAVAACSPLLTPLFTLLLLLSLGRNWGAWALAIGVIIGAVCECALLIFALGRNGVRFLPWWHEKTPALLQVGSQYVPLLFGLLLSTGVTVVDQTMATWLEPGSVAALGYGNRIVSAIVGLVTVSLSAAVIPYFSQMVANEDWGGCQHTLNTYTRLSFVLAAPIVLVLVFRSQAIVHLLYQRGAFSTSDTAVVARVQAMYALQIPFVASGVLYARLLTALKRNDLIMLSAGVNLVLDIVLNLICIKFFGVAGIALSTSLFYVGSFFLLRGIVGHQIRQLRTLNTAGTGMEYCAVPTEQVRL